MSKESLNEREFELISILGEQLGANQRDLSREMNLSLGMINMLIRRLVAKGIIRIEQLNKRKVQYLLTPKGFSEKMQKSIKYAWKTINSIGLIKNSVKNVMLKLYKGGNKKFYILGDSDLGKLVEAVFYELNIEDGEIHFIADMPKERLDGVLLLCKENYPENEFNLENSIDFVHELVQEPSLVIETGFGGNE